MSWQSSPALVRYTSKYFDESNDLEVSEVDEPPPPPPPLPKEPEVFQDQKGSLFYSQSANQTPRLGAFHDLLRFYTGKTQTSELKSF